MSPPPREHKVVFISSSFSKDSFTDSKIVGSHLFSFRVLKILSWISMLLLRHLLQFNFHLFEVILSCLSFKIFFLSLMLRCFIAVCLGGLFFFFPILNFSVSVSVSVSAFLSLSLLPTLFLKLQLPSLPSVLLNYLSYV